VPRSANHHPAMTRLVAAFQEPEPMRANNVGCFRCGLVMTAAHRPDDPTLNYDRGEWKRRCKRPDFGSPARCIAEHHMDIAEVSQHWPPDDWRICKDSNGLTKIC
jgi:hypothetical protein